MVKSIFKQLQDVEIQWNSQKSIVCVKFLNYIDIWLPNQSLVILIYNFWNRKIVKLNE